MSKHDVRTANESKIDEILFEEEKDNDDFLVACKITTGGGYIYIEEGGAGDSVRVTKDSAPDLIKALEKAIQLGWTK